MRGVAGPGARSGSLSEDDGSCAFQIITLYYKKSEPIDGDMVQSDPAGFSHTCLGCRQGAGGGPDEDNVSGLLVRSVAAQWSKNSILAVDAGVHLAAIIRIFEKHTPAAIRFNAVDNNTSPSAAFSQVLPKPNQMPPRPNAARAFSPAIRANEWSTPGSPAPAIDPDAKLVMTTGPFKNILLPCENPKANASLLLRNLISTYLITHPHLDHFAGFAINTAAFHNTSRPKKLAALPGCIDAIKNHVFNDLIWPNLSDEEGGVGFVSYMRLVEGGNIALGDGDGRGYIEVCEGLEVKSFAVSHGHCMRKHTHHGSGQDSSHGHSHERRASRQSIPGSPDMRRNSFPHLDYPARVSVSPCVIDSTAFFIRCSTSGSELLIFGDVEPDSISLTPRNERVWIEAAPKIASGTLKAIFIECSYDDSQSDETLFGHLNPRHLTNEMIILASKVRASRAGASETDAIRKRKRQSDTAEPDRRRGRATSRSDLGRQSASVSPSTQLHNNGDSQSFRPPTDHNRVPSRPRNKPSPPVSDKPLEGLKVVVIHVKESLLDSTPSTQIVLEQLRQYEQKEQLGIEYIIPRVGGSIYF